MTNNKDLHGLTPAQQDFSNGIEPSNVPADVLDPDEDPLGDDEDDEEFYDEEEGEGFDPDAENDDNPPPAKPAAKKVPINYIRPTDNEENYTQDIVSNPSKQGLRELWEDASRGRAVYQRRGGAHSAIEEGPVRGIIHKSTGDSHWGDTLNVTHEDLHQFVHSGKHNNSYHEVYVNPHGNVVPAGPESYLTGRDEKMAKQLKELAAKKNIPLTVNRNPIKNSRDPAAAEKSDVRRVSQGDDPNVITRERTEREKRLLDPNDPDNDNKLRGDRVNDVGQSLLKGSVKRNPKAPASQTEVDQAVGELDDKEKQGMVKKSKKDRPMAGTPVNETKGMMKQKGGLLAEQASADANQNAGRDTDKEVEGRHRKKTGEMPGMVPSYPTQRGVTGGSYEGGVLAINRRAKSK